MNTVLGNEFVLQTLPDLGNSYVPEGLAIEYIYVYMVKDVRTYKGVQLKPNFQHTGTWLAAAWLPHLC
jgi:hypothetical protein